MRDRVTIWFRNRKLWRGAAVTYRCAYEGCNDEISTLRFLLIGCICKPHAWIRRWGG